MFGYIKELEQRGISFKSLEENICSDNPKSDFFSMCSAIVQLEKNIRRETTKKGLSAARARGRNGGRPKGIPVEKREMAYKILEMYEKKELSIREIMDFAGINSANTLYRHMAWARENQAK